MTPPTETGVPVITPPATLLRWRARLVGPHDPPVVDGAEDWELATPTTDAYGREFRHLVALPIRQGVSIFHARPGPRERVTPVVPGGPTYGSTFDHDPSALPDIPEAVALHLAGADRRPGDVGAGGVLCPACDDIVTVVGLTEPDADGWQTYRLDCEHGTRCEPAPW